MTTKNSLAIGTVAILILTIFFPIANAVVHGTSLSPAHSFSLASASQDLQISNEAKPSILASFNERLVDLNQLFGFKQPSQDYLSFLVAPSISSISPSALQTSVTDQNVRVNGSNFVSGLTVTVTFPSGGTGTLSGSQIQNVTSSSFTMRITLNATGTWRIRVNNPNGEMSGQFQFNVTAAQTPTINSISPSSPFASNSDQNVSVSGSNFQNGMTVNVFFPGGGSGTLSGSQLQNVSPTSFTMVVTLNLTGTYGIRINNPSGLNSSTFNFTVRPSVTSFSPSNPCVRNVDQSVTVNGAGFQSGLTVTVTFPTGGSATLSGSQIQSVTPNSFVMLVTLATSGGYGIRVNNPNGTQSNTRTLTPQHCLNISGTSPSSPSQSTVDQDVQVNGSGFASGLTVILTLPNQTTVTLSGSQILNVTSSSFTMRVTLNATGTWKLKVRNSNGNLSNEHSFNVIVATPNISSTSPVTPCVRNVDQSVVVNGSNFVAGLTVTITFPTGGTGTLSGSQIQNVTSSSFTMLITLADPGTYGIRVTNPGGTQSGTFNLPTQNCLTVNAINPPSPTQSNINQDVTVNGNGFVSNLTVIVTLPDNSTVTLSGAQILNVTPTSFIMRVTLNAAGMWKIKVRNPNGDLSNIFTFTVQAPAPPTVTSINPASPSANNVDQSVVVNGTNFQLGLTVTLTFPGGGTGTLSGTQIQNVSSTLFTMRVTLGTAGSWSMRVNNPNGGQSGPFGFNVQSGIQQPVVYSINPATPIAGSTDQDVIVSGANFQPNLQVPITFPGGGGTVLSGQQIQNVTSTSFVMRATLNASGSWTIRVNNPDGGQSPVFGFSVSPGGNNPSISSINPATPMTSGADQNVIVNGSNFQNGLRVNVTFPSGGVSTLQGTSQIQNVTANSFLMRITLNAPGAWTMRVVNPDNSQSGQFQFNVSLTGPPPTGLPTSVLSPVIGPLRVTTSNQGISDGKWEFNQHATGYHTPTGGISLTNDTKAWDVNLYTPTSGNADAGKSVFATSVGEVVTFVGTSPAGGPGAVLIAHPNASNPVWFSGYLHMSNVRVTLGQVVDTATAIGDIGRVGAGNDHLHFAVYSGTNTRGNLRSFNVPIIERGSTTNQPTISSISPGTVSQGSSPQFITINGTNFDATSMIEVQAPNGQSFPILPTGISGIAAQARIESVTATQITASVPFVFANTYEFAVINRSTNATSGACVTSACTVYSAPGSTRTPVILIPGMMGSRLAKYGNGQVGRELWLGGVFNNSDHLELKNDVENPSVWREIQNRQVVATEILRNAGPFNVYGDLISYLMSNEVGYTLYDIRYPTVEPCDTNQTGADLFVFPYDWRNSNWTSARDLYNFVQCIKSIRGNPPNFKVEIVAHSMGGLVARRYILNNLGNHHVDRMVTLGTPWLGAPKVTNILETGDYDVTLNSVIQKSTLKTIVPFIRGAHELIPSDAYTDDLSEPNPGDYPFGENYWDINQDGRFNSQYNFDQLKGFLNSRYPPNSPGTATDAFHSQPFQDNWTNDPTGVTYYNFIGTNRNMFGNNTTIGSVIATLGRDYRGFFDVRYTRGDGTVPDISGARQSNRGNYAGPAIRRWFDNVGHQGLVENQTVKQAIRCVVREPNPSSCLPQLANVHDGISSNAFVGAPSYNLTVIGSPSVSITDSFGNSTNPLSTSVDEVVPTVSTAVTGDNYMSALIPLDQNYRIVLRTSSSNLSVIVTKSDGEQVIAAHRYVDLTLPPDVIAMFQVNAQGVSTLAYDSDGDGSFDTTVNPTIVVNGSNAADLEPPVVTVNETVLTGTSRLDLQATDAGTGVQKIMYSLNGTTFQQFSTPLNLDPSVNPTVYVFADDNVFNRSGLVVHNLATSTAGFTVTGPPVATPGAQVNSNWNAPGGRPMDDWIGLFRMGTLNSAFISRQNTNGQTSGSFSFTLPVQAGIYEFRYLTNGSFTSVAVSDQIIVPMAAEATIRGQVRSSGGRGVSGARLTLIDSQGASRIHMTNPFGYFRFPAVATGQTYTIRVTSKGQRVFTPSSREITLVNDVTDFDFISNY